MAAFAQEIFLETLQGYQNCFNAYLDTFCTARPDAIPARIWDSMVYSLQAGGKRIRPVLTMACAELFGEDRRKVLPIALAFEMVHTASLIHDDLPCMDDDRLRRGKPTNHVVFGEALALLAGDALFLYSFETALRGLRAQGFESELCLEAVAYFSEALGPGGICGGQVLDSDPQSQSDEDDFVLQIASMKTMVLIQAAVVSGAILGGALPADRLALEEYGRYVGIAFQIADDLLDQVGSQEEIGKTLGKDEKQEKRTFVRAYGIEGARKLLKEYTAEAQKIMSPYGARGRFLVDLAQYLEFRSH